LIGFIIREFNTEHPVVDLRVFRYRSYSAGVFLMTVLGFVLYGSTVLVPLMLQTLLGYPAVQAGIVMLPRGLGSFLAMPLVGFLMSKVEPRRLLGTGIVIATLSFWKFSHLSLDAGYWDFFIPLIVQGAAMGLLFVPLTTITNDPVPKEEIGNATSLFNLMRNIGASIGIASVTTLLSRNQQKHINILGGHVTVFDPQAQSMINSLKASFMKAGSDPATALQQAYAAVAGMVNQNAYMLAFNDAFRFMMIMFALMLPLIFVMRKPQHKGGPIAAH
jgi:MFS transporter, DHA2 family, multidrug resistance protein